MANVPTVTITIEPWFLRDVCPKCKERPPEVEGWLVSVASADIFGGLPSDARCDDPDSGLTITYPDTYEEADLFVFRHLLPAFKKALVVVKSVEEAYQECLEREKERQKRLEESRKAAKAAREARDSE